MNDRFNIVAEIISGVVGCRTEEVTAAAPIGSLPQWDSIAHLSIIMAVEERLGRQLLAEETASLETVASFLSLFDPPGKVEAAT